MLLQSLLWFCYAVIVHAHTHLGRTARVIEARQINNETTYDFIIAGGGIAGLTVADRLTENQNGISIAFLKSYTLIVYDSYCTSHRIRPVRPGRRRCHDPWCLLPSTVPLAAVGEHTTSRARWYVVWCAMW
jgi:hypothetical protein